MKKIVGFILLVWNRFVGRFKKKNMNRYFKNFDEFMKDARSKYSPNPPTNIPSDAHNTEFLYIMLQTLYANCSELEKEIEFLKSQKGSI